MGQVLSYLVKSPSNRNLPDYDDWEIIISPPNLFENAPAKSIYLIDFVPLIEFAEFYAADPSQYPRAPVVHPGWGDPEIYEALLTIAIEEDSVQLFTFIYLSYPEGVTQTNIPKYYLGALRRCRTTICEYIMTIFPDVVNFVSPAQHLEAAICSNMASLLKSALDSNYGIDDDWKGVLETESVSENNSRTFPLLLALGYPNSFKVLVERGISLAPLHRKLKRETFDSSSPAPLKKQPFDIIPPIVRRALSGLFKSRDILLDGEKEARDTASWYYNFFHQLVGTSSFALEAWDDLLFTTFLDCIDSFNHGSATFVLTLFTSRPFTKTDQCRRTLDTFSVASERKSTMFKSGFDQYWDNVFDESLAKFPVEQSDSFTKFRHDRLQTLQLLLSINQLKLMIVSYLEKSRDLTLIQHFALDYDRQCVDLLMAETGSTSWSKPLPSLKIQDVDISPVSDPHPFSLSALIYWSRFQQMPFPQREKGLVSIVLQKSGMRRGVDRNCDYLHWILDYPEMQAQINTPGPIGKCMITPIVAALIEPSSSATPSTLSLELMIDLIVKHKANYLQTTTFDHLPTLHHKRIEAQHLLKSPAQLPQKISGPIIQPTSHLGLCHVGVLFEVDYQLEQLIEAVIEKILANDEA